MVRDCRPDDIGVSVSYPLPGTTFYERVKAQLGQKQNWVDSDDLAMMYRATYVPEFYRALHALVHAEFRARKSCVDAARGIARRPWSTGRESARDAAAGVYARDQSCRWLAPQARSARAAGAVDAARRHRSRPQPAGRGRAERTAGGTRGRTGHGRSRAAPMSLESALRTAMLIRLAEVTNRTFVLPLLIFYPTSRCNSRCVSCDWWKAQRRRRSQRSPRSRELADDAAGARHRGSCVFSGGEPLLRPEVFDAAADVPRRGIPLHLLTSGVLLERCAADVARQFLARHRLARRDDRGAVPRRPRRRRRWRRSSAAWRGCADLAPGVPVTARATLHRLNFRELPRLDRPRPGDGARRHLVSAGRRLVGRVRPRASGRSLAALALSRDRGRGVRGDRSKRRSDDHADDFESGFVAESPEKLRRLPRYYAALAGRPVSARRLQRALHVGGRRSGRRRCGRASSTSRSATSATRRSRRSSTRNLPAFRRTLDMVRNPGVRAVRLLDEDRLEERAVALIEQALADTQQAFDGVAGDYDRSNAENPMLRAMRRRVLDAIVAHTPVGGTDPRSRMRSRHRCRSACAMRLPA